MNSLFRFAKSQILLHKDFILYGIISVFVTIIDIITCRVCETWFSSVFSNTVGVVTGFVIQYFLTSRHVYNKSNIKSFVVFLWTFGVGLIFANSIIYVFRTIIFSGSDGRLAFLVSKGVSIVLPFFLMYFLRKKFMPNSSNDKEIT